MCACIARSAAGRWCRRTARRIARCWARICLGVDAGRDVGHQRRLEHLEDPARSARAGGRCPRPRRGSGGSGVSALLKGSVPGWCPTAASIASSSRATTSSSALTAARPAIGTSSESRASSSSLHRDALGGQHQRDRLADVAAHPLARRAGHEDPARAAAADADQVRGRQQPQRLAQRRAADAELVGHLLLGADPLARLAGAAPRAIGESDRRSPRWPRRPSGGAPAGDAGAVSPCRHATDSGGG